MKYFVSINFFEGNRIGFGHYEVKRNKPICGIDDIRDIANSIRDSSGCDSVTVISWQLFEDKN